MDRAIRQIEKQIDGVDSIEKWATTIQSNSGRILEKTERVRGALGASVESLDEVVAQFRASAE
jgi:hypothetical protein